MIDPPNPTQNAADHCRIKLSKTADGAARPVAWAYDAAKHAAPGRDYRRDGQPVVFSGVADGSLFASDARGATCTLSPSERAEFVQRIKWQWMTRVEVFSEAIDYESLADFQRRIAVWLDLVPSEFHDEIEVRTESDERDDDGADGIGLFSVSYSRPPSLEEQAKRDAAVRRRQAAIEEHERSMLRALIAKYGIPSSDAAEM
jgi:hypothetical protein